MSRARRARASPRCSQRCCTPGVSKSTRSRCSRWTPARAAPGARCSGDRARIEFDPTDRGVFIRSTAAGRAAGRPGMGHSRGRPGAGGGLRRGGDRDGRRGAGGDRDRGGRGHGGGDRAARLRRRAAVPEVGDHGDPRRAGRDQGRPRPAGAQRATRPERRVALAGQALHAGARGLLAAPAERHRGAGAGRRGPPREHRRPRPAPARTSRGGADGLRVRARPARAANARRAARGGAVAGRAGPRARRGGARSCPRRGGWSRRDVHATC